MNNSLGNFLLVAAIVFVLFMVLLGLAAYFAIRWFQRFLAPDAGEMQKKLQALRLANPNASTDTLVRKVIQQQSLKCGIVGAITGLGGFITLPVALPIDILVSMRIQATMVQFIALLYDQTNHDSEDLRLQTYLVMSGGVEVTETTFNVIMKFVLRILGESLAILVPAIGAIVGFGVNYALATATGNIALRWYEGKAKPAITA